MTLLLLTDTPPSSDTEAGRVLAALCRQLGAGNVACFVVRDRTHEPQLYPDLDWLPLAMTEKPNERGFPGLRRRRAARIATMVLEAGRAAFYTPQLVDMATSFGRAHGATAVWAVLNGQTMTRMALPVARKLRAKLFSQVHGPINWWLVTRHIEKINRTLTRRVFAKTLAASEGSAAATWGMAELFEHRFGKRSIPVLPSLPADVAREPLQGLRPRGHFSIAIPNDPYVVAEFARLVSFLEANHWILGSREVRLRAYGPHYPEGSMTPDHVDYIGDLSDAALVADLAAEADFIYCAHPFRPEMHELARQCLPPNLAAHLASGVPMLFNGPDYSTVGQFLERTGAAMVCKDTSDKALLHALLRLMVDPDAYGKVAAAASAAFHANFTNDVQRANFDVVFGGVLPNAGAARQRRSWLPERLEQYGTPARHQKAEAEGLRRKLALSRATPPPAPPPPPPQVIHAPAPVNSHSALPINTDEIYVLQARLQHAERLLAETNWKPPGRELEDALERVRSYELIIEHEREQFGHRTREANHLRELLRQQEGADLAGYKFAVDLGRAERSNDALLHKAQGLLGAFESVSAKASALRASLDQSEATSAALLAERDVLRVVVTTRDDVVVRNEQMAAGIDFLQRALSPAPQALAGLTTRIYELVEALTGPQSIRDAELRMAGRLSVVADNLETLKRTTMLQNIGGAGDSEAVITLYLDLLEASLCGTLNQDPNIAPWGDRAYEPDKRLLGRDWPQHAVTMIGRARMRNIRTLVRKVLEAGVPGDFLEAGVWRGGACIYMKGTLTAYGDKQRTVWVADSFAGLPPPEPDLYPADANDEHHTVAALAVSEDDVRANFAAYGLLDDRVRFLRGFFKDTLPGAPVSQLALLRLDGDMYSSTMETLQAMYHRVSPGGYIIVDDYILPACRQAIDDYREKHGISEPLVHVDGAAVYWRKGGAEEAGDKSGLVQTIKSGVRTAAE